MVIRLIFVASFMFFASALDHSDGFSRQDIVRRMDEMEERNRKQHDSLINEINRLKARDVLQTNRIAVLEEREATRAQHELQNEALAKQNDAIVNEVNRLKERDVQQANRIAVLEEREKAMAATIDVLVKRIQDGVGIVSSCNDGNGKVNPQPEDGGDLSGEKTEGETRPVKGQNRIRQVDQETTVAFFSTMTNHSYHMGQNQPVVFDNTITNIGQAYHPTSGTFFAPVSGVYVFSTTIFMQDQTAHFEYDVNGKFMSQMYTNSASHYETTSQTVVFSLSKGDEVTIRNRDANAWIHGSHYSSISGFLLTSNLDAINSQIVG